MSDEILSSKENRFIDQRIKNSLVCKSAMSV
jgi:hypothetical protein